MHAPHLHREKPRRCFAELARLRERRRIEIDVGVKAGDVALTGLHGARV
jgi:hypothetical protein